MTTRLIGRVRTRAWPRAATCVALAVAARTICLVILSPHDRFAGGDGPWYVHQAWLMVHGGLAAPLSTVGPLYPLVLAGIWMVSPSAAEPTAAHLVPAAYLTLVRVVQIGFDALTVWAVHRLAQRLAGNDRAAALAALGVALGPAFVMTPFQILTESLFTMLVVLAILLYVRAQRSPTGAGVTAAAVVFGLAAMTRPVVWLLPMALAVHLMALRGRRRGLRWASVLLGGYLVTLAPWHAYLYAATGSPMPQGLLANLWLGATGEGRWTGRQAMDDRRRRFQGGDEDYANEALAAIRANPLGWARLRATRMAEAVLQPHGTQDLTGPPVKSAIASVVRGDAPPRVLWPHAASGTFWLKAAIYAFHYAALLLGAVGMWQVRHAWRDWFGPYAIIVYLCLVHGALTVLPRYLFPATPFLWIFAAASVARMRGWRS